MHKITGHRTLAKIGEGAASQIYVVQNTKTKQVYAVKHVIRNTEKDDRFIDQVEMEYSIGMKLDHGNLRKLHKLIKHRKMFKVQSVSLMMEMVDGTPMDQQHPADQAQAVRIFRQIAAGLSHMHRRGFVHADIKPHNIMLDEHEHVKIIDLGQACAIGTVKKRIQGTPGYMAPEQAHRQAITPKTDIYNLGATMYFLLVGELIPTALPPKDEQSGNLFSGALDTSQVHDPVPPSEKDPSIHPLLSKQILDCVQLHPNDRPESMEFVSNRLELIGDVLEGGKASSGT